MTFIIGILVIGMSFVISCCIFIRVSEVVKNPEPIPFVSIIVVLILIGGLINNAYMKNVFFETEYLTIMKNRELRNYKDLDEFKEEKLDFLEKIRVHNINVDFWHWGLNKVDISKYTFEPPTKLKNEE